ncbi:MAG: glycosyl transferase, partial [Microbacterium sp.]|nr:glycosyl transferase [Microbacterium sp.]
TFVKEIIRLLVVERKISGTRHLFRGLRDGRKIAGDRNWRPMPSLDAAQPSL